MRRFGVLLVLFAIMASVHALKAEWAGAGDPMTLAAIGFVVLAAFTIAEIGSVLGLPRVTGYIVAGAALGPSVANLLSHAVVTEMKMFNTLALGLIATAAGLEIDARQIARIYRTLLSTILVKIVLGVLLVGGALFAIEATLGAMRMPSVGATLALCAVFGVLSLGTSPAIALAVITETRSKGRLSDLILGAAVLKDLLVVAGLAAAVAVSKQLLGSAGTEPAALVLGVGREIAVSIAVGAALGVLLIVYLRYVRAEMLLFVAAMILVTAELSSALHLEFLLVFLTAGFVVRNFSRHGHDLVAPVQMVALPVFVVFFTNAGASIDLRATLALLPIALALGAMRALTYFAASRLGGRAGHETQAIRRHAWLGYLPQAGVTLGLVGVASQELPEIGTAISSLGMAVVAVNLLLGPIALRYALRASGEVPVPAAPGKAADRDSDRPRAEGEQAFVRVAEVLDRIENERVANLIRRLAREASARLAELVEGQIAQWTTSTQADVTRLLGADEASRLQRIAGWAEVPPPSLPGDRATAGQELFRRLRERLRRLPDEIALPVEARHWQAVPGDGLSVRWQKGWLRWRARFDRRLRRRVPLSMLSRVCMEERLASFCRLAVDEWNRTEAGLIGDLQQLTNARLPCEEARSSIEERLVRLRERVSDDAERALALGLQELLERVDGAGTPILAASSIRYSNIEPEVRAALKSLETRAAAWSSSLRAARSALQLAAQLAALRNTALRRLQGGVIAPMKGALEDSAATIAEVKDALLAAADSLDEAKELNEPERKQVLAAVQSAFGEQVWTRLERDAARFRSGVSTHPLTLSMRAALEDLPAESLVVDPSLLAFSQEPEAAAPRRVRVRDVWTERMLHEMLPGIDEDVRQTAVSVVASTQRVHEAEEVVLYALAQADSEGAQAAAMIRDALQRAAQRLNEQAAVLTESAEATEKELVRRATAAFEVLESTVATGQDSKSRHARAVFSSLRHLVLGLGGWAGRMREHFDATADRMGKNQLSLGLFRRYQKVRLDAGRLNEQVARWSAPGELPEVYGRLFSLDPLVGPRLFAAYREQLDAVVAAERAWMSGGPSSALVVGVHGSGRTSILNLAKLELSAPRMLRPEPLQSRRDLGPIGALSLTLGVKPASNAIVRALSSTRTVVVLDDLEQWFTPDPRGLRELERFLDLAVRTARTTFWLATVESSALQLFEEAFSVTQVFGRVLRLEPLGPKEIAKVVGARQLLSGRELRFAPTPASRLMSRLPGLGDREVLFRVLTSLSEGNLARLLLIWRHCITISADGAVLASLRRAIEAVTPFIGRLSHRDETILALLLRFGALRYGQLAQLLALPHPEIKRRVAFLRASGLVEGGQAEQAPIEIPLLVRPLLGQDLKNWQVRA